MKMFKSLLLALIGGFALILAVHGENHSGFINIDCGAKANYADPRTKLFYLSDAKYINTGKSYNVSTSYGPQQVRSLRSFPDGNRNCYNVKVTSRTKYLVRAMFLHGNYDGNYDRPRFDLYIGAKKWTTLDTGDDAYDASTIISPEIIHVATSDYIYVCLMNTGSGVPFISAIEFRPLPNNIYVTGQSESLVLVRRWNYASETEKRYPDDVFDRIWYPMESQWLQRNEMRPVVNTSLSVNITTTDFLLPLAVMRSAFTPLDKTYFYLYFNTSILTSDLTSTFYAYMHFAELRNLKSKESTSFDISVNGNPWKPEEHVVLEYLATRTVQGKTGLTGKSGYNFMISGTEDSALPPILNAMEFYRAVELSQPETHQGDVDAIMEIKHVYTRNDWQGDPCSPQNDTFRWKGLDCRDDRIFSLRLPSSGLTGKIAPSLANLIMLEYLDLSNNTLTGKVPEFLSQMPSLKVLDLRGNTLTGSVPCMLLEKRSLMLRVDGNPNLSPSVSCSKKKRKFVVPLLASLASFLLLTVLVIFWILKRTKGGKLYAKFNIRDGSLDSKKKRYTYAEVLHITGNFKTFLGRGSFGDVFHGYLKDGTEVAVKMLSKSSTQGIKEFLAEVKLLLTVHHRNLTTLFGYCDDGTKIGLIYEYMANGNLKERLSDSRATLLSWEERLRIAVEAGQGLEYLHDGCKPPTVHRDVKSANILLDDKFEAKIADFGMSRTFVVDGASHESTIVVGTPGYLDPEYFLLNMITEKSDVYSFGIVIFEIITSQPVFTGSSNGNRHISQWVGDMLSQGDIRNIVDPRLQGEYDTNSAWKSVEVAMNCVSPTSTGRPNMNDVVRELKECLGMEVARKNGNQMLNPNESILMNSSIELSPLAR